MTKVTSVFIAGRTLLRLVSTLLESSGRFDRKPIILPPCAARDVLLRGTKVHPTLAVYIADRFSILKAFLSSSIFCHHADCRRVEVLRFGDYVLLIIPMKET